MIRRENPQRIRSLRWTVVALIVATLGSLATPRTSAEQFFVGSFTNGSIYRYDFSEGGNPILDTSFSGQPNVRWPTNLVFSNAAYSNELIYSDGWNGNNFLLGRSNNATSTTPSVTGYVSASDMGAANGTSSAAGVWGLALATDGSGDFYTSRAGADSILRVRPTVSGATTLYNSAGLPGTRGMAVSPWGEIFVSDFANDQVLRYIDTGSGFSSNGTIPVGDSPHGLVFRGNELFVANANSNSVSRLTFTTNDTSGSAIAGSTITGNGLSGPNRIAVTPWGELLVDNGIGGPATTISRFTFASVGEGAASSANGAFNAGFDTLGMAFVEPFTGSIKTIWDGNSDSDGGDGISWGDVANWSSHVAPDADREVVFDDTAGTGTTTILDTARTIDRLTYKNTAGTHSTDLNGLTLTVANRFSVGEVVRTSTVAVSNGTIDLGATGDLAVGTSAGDGDLTLFGGADLSGDDAAIGIGTNSDGLLTIDGVFSSIDFSTMRVATAGGTGDVEVTGGAIADVDDLTVGSGTNSLGTVTSSVTGSYLRISNAMVVGEAGGNGTINIENDGNVQISGTTESVVGQGGTGALNIGGNTAYMSSNGDLVVADGSGGNGDLQITTDGRLWMANDRLTIGRGSGSGGEAVVSGSNATLAAYQVYVGDDGGNGTLDITLGGRVDTFSSDVVIGNGSGSVGSVTVDGQNSVFSIFDDLVVGVADGTGTLIVSNGALVELRNTSGSDMWIGDGAAGGGSGTVTVTGSGSRLLLPQASGVTTFIANDSPQVGQLNVTNGGVVTGGQFQVGFNGGSASIQINSGGSLSASDVIFVGNGNSVTLDGSTSVLSTSYISLAGSGQFHFLAGTYEVNGNNVVIDDDPSRTLNNGSGQGQSADGTTFVLASNRNLHVEFNTHINANKGLEIDGGRLRTGTISVEGSGTPLVFTSGELELTNSNLLIGSGGPLRQTVTTLDAGKTLRVSGTTFINAGAALDFAGGTFEGGSINLDNFSFLRGDFGTSTADAAILALGGSFIQVISGDLTIGNDTKPNGFYSNGRVDVNIGSTLRIEDANDAVFDSAALVTIGGGGTPGTIEAANGITFDFGSNVTGFGTIDTPDDVFKRVTANGNINGDSLAEPITMTGYVKGVGTFNNVQFTGTHAPGLSPTRQIVGSLIYAPSSTLEIELGGTTAGSEHDQLLSNGTLMIDGTLDLQIVNGYTPTLGDTMDILVADTIVGTFNQVNNVVESGGLGLAVRYASNLVDVRVSIRGDTDFDDDVDTVDLTTAIIGFTGAGGSGNTWVNGDFDGDGDTDTVDLTAGIIGFTGASAANPNVPDLVYDLATGNVSIDADGADVISFSLQGGPFASADFSELPAGLTDNIATQIGWTSFNLFSGLTGSADLGAILPAGLNAAQLDAALSTASYGLALAGGGGGGRLDIVIPEPGTVVLLGVGAVVLGRRRAGAGLF